MENSIKYNDRCIALAEYLIENSSTVRETAAEFGISKSTVHKDITERLRRLSPSLHKDVKRVLDKNKSERHLRGGEATREKYLKLAEQKNKQYADFIKK